MRELPDFDIYTPENAAQVLELLHAGDALLFAGGTDLIPMMKRGKIRPRKVVDLSGVAELRYIQRGNGYIRMGPRATVKDLVESDLLDGRYAAIKLLGRYFGVETTRTMATVGGNLASGGERDLPQILDVLNARVKILSVDGERFAGPMECEPRSHELVGEIVLPELEPNSQTWFSKFEKRAANGIGVVTTAVYLRLSEDGIVEDVRVTLNRVRGKMPGRVHAVEKLLRGHVLDDCRLDGISAAMDAEISPASDFRASSDFRKHISKVLVRRALLECARRIGGWESIA
ncbi:MAG: FAD binding domain-containing protein [Nitrososphaerota archaeon]